MARGKLKGTSLYDLGRKVQKTTAQGKTHKSMPSIVEGIKPRKVNLEPGRIHWVGPDELASFLVPVQEVDGDKIHGFQREVKRAHARKIALAVSSGKQVPSILVSSYKQSNWIVDGQQRAISGIISGQKVPVEIRNLNADEMYQLFSDQSKGMKVNPSKIILAAKDDPFALYVQDAVTDSNSIWHSLVTHNVTSNKKMTPKQMYDSVASYVGNTLGAHAARGATTGTFKFDEKLSNELAPLFKVFGNKETAPEAFRPVSIKAITYAATLIIRRGGSKPGDIARWSKHMPQFPFEDYLRVRKSKELAWFLVSHWNKRLKPENRISMQIVTDELM